MVSPFSCFLYQVCNVVCCREFLYRFDLESTEINPISQISGLQIDPRKGPLRVPLV